MSMLDMMTGPWAILPATLVELQALYAHHVRGDNVDIAALESRMGRPLASEQQTYQVLDGGVAVLRASGVMAPKVNLLTQVSGGISTQMLSKQFDGLAADASVRSVVFAPDSPGGNVLGVPAAAKALAHLARLKPTVTVGEGVMASGMYWVASAANAMYIEGETDMVGSIGVVQRLSWDAGSPNSMELVRGKYKRVSVNGKPPSAEVLAQAERQLDYIYKLFVDTVALHRGTIGRELGPRWRPGRRPRGDRGLDRAGEPGAGTRSAEQRSEVHGIGDVIEPRVA